MMAARVGEKVLKNGKEDFNMSIRGYNTLGEEV